MTSLHVCNSALLLSKWWNKFSQDTIDALVYVQTWLASSLNELKIVYTTDVDRQEAMYQILNNQILWFATQ